MFGHNKKFIVAISACILLGAGCAGKMTESTPLVANTIVAIPTVTTTSPETTKKNVPTTLYFIAMQGTDAWKSEETLGSNKKIGCEDYAVPANMIIETTQADLAKQTMEKLFSLTGKEAAELGLTNILSKSSITVEKVEENMEGAWDIYLKGTFNSSGVCDDPRIKAQVGKTAEQFGAYRIFLNGKESEWRCFGDQSGACN